MDNMNRYLNEQVMREMVQGGPAYYRQAHQATNRMAQYHELDEEQGVENVEAVKRHRTVCVRLPWMAPKYVRLPEWMLVGRLTA